MTRRMLPEEQAFRRLLGRNICLYMRARGWSQKQLAAEAKMRANHLNGVINGKRPISAPQVAAIASALDNCTPADLYGLSLPTRWEGVEKRLVDRMSLALGVGWYELADRAWSRVLPVTAFSKLEECFARALAEIELFEVSWDFLGIRGALDEIIHYCARATEADVPRAAYLTFEAADRLVHGQTYSLPSPEVLGAATPYLALMDRVCDCTRDPTLRARVKCRRGDVLKIHSEHDPRSLAEAWMLLKPEAVGRRWQFSRSDYPAVRSFLIIAGKTLPSDREFDRALAAADEAAQASWFDKSRTHIFDGGAQACAYRFDKSGNKKYEAEALSWYEKAAPKSARPQPEWHMRWVKLPALLAFHRIPALVERGGAQIIELRHLARKAGNRRVALQTESLFAELTRRGTISAAGFLP